MYPQKVPLLDRLQMCPLVGEGSQAEASLFAGNVPLQGYPVRWIDSPGPTLPIDGLKIELFEP